jgi:hypothetical protein
MLVIVFGEGVWGGCECTVMGLAICVGDVTQLGDVADGKAFNGHFAPIWLGAPL